MRFEVDGRVMKMQHFSPVIISFNGSIYVIRDRFLFNVQLDLNSPSAKETYLNHIYLLRSLGGNFLLFKSIYSYS